MKFEQDADGVTVWLRHVDTGKEEIVRADFLIGADGARGKDFTVNAVAHIKDHLGK